MTDQVLITGGLGFIGSHLSRRFLQERDVELTIIDDLSGTQTDWEDLDRSNSTVLVGDLRSLGIGDAYFDEVWHLASPVGSLGILDRTGYIANDIVALASHAHDLAAAGGKKLRYISSSEVYGRDGKFGEEVDLVVPARFGARMEYALGKLTAEHVLHNRSVDSGVDLRTIRPFNCAGPQQSTKLGFVVPTFVEAALGNQPLPVHGDGSARRAFCHVEDMVDGLLAVHDRGTAGAVYNVGQPSDVTNILDLAKLVIAELDSSSAIVHLDPHVEFGAHWIAAYDKLPDISRLIRDTSWAPRRTIEDIIGDTAAALQRRVGAHVD